MDPPFFLSASDKHAPIHAPFVYVLQMYRRTLLELSQELKFISDDRMHVVVTFILIPLTVDVQSEKPS